MSKSRSVGTKLLINTKVIGGLKSIGGIEITADTTDVTDLGNEDGYKEFLAGFKDGGEVAVSGYLDSENEGQTEVYDVLNEGDGDSVPCEIRFPPKIGMSWYFNAVPTKFATSAELEDAITFEAALKVSGKPELKATTKPSAPAENSPDAEAAG